MGLQLLLEATWGLPKASVYQDRDHPISSGQRLEWVAPNGPSHLSVKARRPHGKFQCTVDVS